MSEARGPDCHKDARMAGQTRRWHTWPVIREQSVAEHSWQVARILLAVYPSAGRGLIIHALHHDTGEGGAAGDIPGNAKRESSVLQIEADRLEAQSYQSMIIPWHLPTLRLLSDFERWVLKLANYIEQWEYSLQERMMGNQLMRLVTSRTEEEIRRMTLPAWKEPHSEVIEAAEVYMSRRRATWQTM